MARTGQEKEPEVVTGVESPDTILAAGGVLWRPAAGSPDEVEIAIIHRPRYDDWSIPKGKLNPGEIAIEGAVREVNEETGYRATIVRPLGHVEYLKDGRPKIVRYWSMRAMGGVFVSGREVDELRWVSPGQAMGLLSAERYRELLTRFTEGPATTRTVLLVRHATAGSRSNWSGSDEERPLDSGGRHQADALIWLLTRWDVREVYSAPPLRCRQTVEPLASSVGLAVQVTPLFSENDYYGREGEAQRLVREMGTAGTATVLCSQGGVIPDFLRRLSKADGGSLPDPLPARKGSVWSLTFDGDRLFDAEYFPPLS
jgi:8-oxo-dGTP diphosphatase